MIDGHGDDRYRYGSKLKANFSSNIYSHADLSGLKEYLKARMDVVGSYPEPEPYTLEKALAQCHGLQPQEVLATNGATQAIYLIAQAFAGSRTAVLQPTFTEYADACRMFGHRLQALYMLPAARDDYRLPEELRMLWLCNPNNPTGKVLDVEYLEMLMQRNPQVLFVIDRSYEDFTLKLLPAVRHGVELGNVLMLHSMTKHYAIPGLRLGYVTGDGKLIDRLRARCMPWAVNALAIEAGHWLLKHGELCVRGTLKDYLAETERFRKRLLCIGALEVWETDTHFMLARLRTGFASALKEWLMQEKGLLIRDASNFEGLDRSYFRVATQDPEENDMLADAINEWIHLC